MCGIFGVISTGKTFDASACDQFVSLTDMVQYRGPDDHGYVCLDVRQAAPATPEHFDVFLGSRRLSIIDLSPAGHMPMTDGSGRWITFNGEIFNYVELRQELESLGHRFHTSTDTEIILHVYDQFGEDGFDRLNGMWAFALVDLTRKRVVLSRDRFSIKPLYLFETGNAVYFGSEIKQLLPFLNSVQPNETVLSDFLLQGLLDHSAATFFNDVKRVPPRTSVVFDLEHGTRTEKQYWDFRPAQPAPDEDPIERFRQLFADSVKIRLRSDVKVGVLLSGGLDSSAIAVTCNRLAEAGLETYSIVSHDGLLDERKFIDVLIAAGIKNRKVAFAPSDVLDDLEKAIYHSDEPFGGFSVLAQYKLLRAIRQETDATVLLSGQGGDEILLGYLKFYFFYLRQLVRQRKYGAAASQALISMVKGTVMRQFTFREARRYLPGGSNGLAKVFRRNHNAVPIWDCGDMRQRQIVDIEQFSVPALTHYEDRNSSAHSLEVRHPFLDHRLVNYVVNLPAELKIHQGWTKYVLRQAIHELPPEIRWRTDKQAFLTPEEAWLKSDFSGRIRQMFQNSRLQQMGILNDSEFLGYYDRFCGGERISPSNISRVLIAEMWARRHFN